MPPIVVETCESCPRHLCESCNGVVDIFLGCCRACMTALHQPAAPLELSAYCVGNGPVRFAGLLISSHAAIPPELSLAKIRNIMRGMQQLGCRLKDSRSSRMCRTWLGTCAATTSTSIVAGLQGGHNLQQRWFLILHAAWYCGAVNVQGFGTCSAKPVTQRLQCCSLGEQSSGMIVLK